MFLKKLSRRTWRYFEAFVTEQENWLPPDNFQEHPAPVIAPRTSPTNIGMALLADLAAYDFGYCSVARLLDRTQKTLGTLGKMERYRGHFYNWYDTRSLKPLLPSYVSMVDSGNLAGHLLVLRSGLLELHATPVLPSRLFDGLRDTVRVLLDAARGLHQPDNASPRPLVAADVLRKIERIESDLGHPPANLRMSVAMLSRLASAAGEVVTAVGGADKASASGFRTPSAGMPGEGRKADEQVQWWARTFEQSCVDHRDDLIRCAEWLTLPPIPEMMVRGMDPARAMIPLESASRDDSRAVGVMVRGETVAVGTARRTILPEPRTEVRSANPPGPQTEHHRRHGRRSPR